MVQKYEFQISQIIYFHIILTLKQFFYQNITIIYTNLIFQFYLPLCKKQVISKYSFSQHIRLFNMRNKQKLILNDKPYFEKIPQSKRNIWLQKMFQTQQIKHQPSKVFIQQHESSKNYFQYKNWILNYHKVQKYCQPKAILFWFHGINGHAGNYAYVSNNLVNSLQMNVYLLDLMNFGQSQGNQRGCINSFQQCLDQAQKFIIFILQKYKNKNRPKIYLGGHSMGATMCFHLSIQRPNFFSGVIFFAPALRDLPNLKIVKQITKVFGYLFPQAKTIQSRFDSSTKYDCTSLFMKDKYNYLDRLIPGSFRVMLNQLQKTEKMFKKFKDPYIAFQGGNDKVIDPFAAIDLQKQCQSKDKTTVYFKDMWHSIPYEEQIQKIVKILIFWLKQRI